MGTEVKTTKIKSISIKKSPKTMEEEMRDMKLKLAAMTEMFKMLKKITKKKLEENREDEASVEELVFNKDGIPLNSSFLGYTSKSPYPYILTVGSDGIYRVGTKEFASLSAAAEFVSGVRRSGWTFWKLVDGRTLKEVYKK